MKPGTPGFVGARLREAREARGLTATSLAELLGVTRQAVSQYETGSGSPSPETMDKIATMLNLPLLFFCRPVAEEPERTVFYRSMSAATKAARIKAETRINWVRDILVLIEEYVDLPATNLPPLGLPAEITRISVEQIEEAAAAARRYWGLGNGPIPDVVRLLEKNGVIVARASLDADTLDAFSTWAGDRPVIVLGADKGSAARSRFDAGHELGHLLMHRHVDKKLLVRGSDFKLLEEQAHRFSSAFLLPAQSFSRDVYAPSLDTFRRLKSKWGASIGMMIKRAQSLNLVSDDQARYLWISYSKRGWRTHEPLDDEIPVEQPHLMRASIELMAGTGALSRTEFASLLPYSHTDIEELAALPHGYLVGDVPEVRYLGPSLKENYPSREVAGAPHNVVPFRGRS